MPSQAAPLQRLLPRQCIVPGCTPSTLLPPQAPQSIQGSLCWPQQVQQPALQVQQIVLVQLRLWLGSRSLAPGVRCMYSTLENWVGQGFVGRACTGAGSTQDQGCAVAGLALTSTACLLGLSTGVVRASQWVGLPSGLGCI